MKAASIEIRKNRGVMVVRATGLTGRGQRYTKGSIPLKAKSMSDPKFKEEMTAAVDKLLEGEA